MKRFLLMLCLAGCGSEAEVLPEAPQGLQYKGAVYPVRGELIEEGPLSQHYLWLVEFTDAKMQENNQNYFESGLVLDISLHAVGTESFTAGEFIFAEGEPAGQAFLKGSLFEDSNQNGKVEKQFDEKHSISGGMLRMEKKEGSDAYHITFDLSLDNGETLKGEYDQALLGIRK